MFKELGEFIDNVGRATGIVVKRLLSDNEPLEMTGDMDVDEDLPKEVQEELGMHSEIIVIDEDKSDV